MEQSELMGLIINALESSGAPYMITGSQASAYYGEPRFTRDIDVVAEMKNNQIDNFIKFFPEDEFYCDEEMRTAAIKTNSQFNIIHSGSGLKVDVILKKGTDFSQTEFSRKKKGMALQDKEANFASPEDVIISKMEYYREGGSEKHLRDITGILKISGDDVDLKYISGWAERLGYKEIWEALLKRVKE